MHTVTLAGEAGGWFATANVSSRLVSSRMRVEMAGGTANKGYPALGSMMADSVRIVDFTTAGSCRALE